MHFVDTNVMFVYRRNWCAIQ